METYKAFKKDLNAIVLFIVVIVVLLDIITWTFNLGYDSTDDNLNSKRSGVSLRTDYGTGYQYL